MKLSIRFLDHPVCSIWPYVCYISYCAWTSYKTAIRVK